MASAGSALSLRQHEGSHLHPRAKRLELRSLTSHKDITSGHAPQAKGLAKDGAHRRRDDAKVVIAGLVQRLTQVRQFLRMHFVFQLT